MRIKIEYNNDEKRSVAWIIGKIATFIGYTSEIEELHYEESLTFNTELIIIKESC